MRAWLPDSLLGLIAGPVIWSLYFVASYVISGYACSVEAMTGRAVGLSPVQWLILAVGLLTVLLIVLTALQAFRGRRRAKMGVTESEPTGDAHRQTFLFTASLGLCGFSLVGVLWLMTAAAVAPVC